MMLAADRENPAPDILIADPPGHEGWFEWRTGAPSGFNQSVLGFMLVKPDEKPGFARVRLFPQPHQMNVNGVIHGGATLGFIDASLFGASTILSGSNQLPGSTVELSTQFITPGAGDKPLDSLVEILRETKRMLFLQGKVVQEDVVVAAFSGIVRKVT